jgi:hypothetical protein
VGVSLRDSIGLHGEHWGIFGEDVDATVVAVIENAAADGRAFVLGPHAEGRAVAKATLWPGTALEFLVLHDAQSGAVIAAYPFAAHGPQQDFHIVEVLAWRDGSQGWLHCIGPGGIDLTFFDTTFFAHGAAYAPGVQASFFLSGLAYGVEVVRPEPIPLGAELAPPLPAELRTEGAAMLLPAGEDVDEYSIQAPVKEVEAFTLAGANMTRLRVTVARPDDTDIDVDVYVAEDAWRTAERPVVGSDVAARLWLMGRLVGDLAAAPAKKRAWWPFGS